MEIIVEIIVALFGGIIEFLFSAVFQAIAQVLGLAGDLVSSRKNKNAAAPELSDAAALRARRIRAGFTLFFWTIGGFCAGAISLVISPNLYLPAGWQRYANLVMTPLICGALTQIAHKWIDDPDKEPPVISHFVHGFVFALAMALVRFGFGK